MKVLFHVPKENRYSINALVAAAEKFFIINKVEVYFTSNTRETLNTLKTLTNNGPVLLVLSFFSTQYWDIEELTKEVKSLKKDVRIVAGGPHPTGDPVSTLKAGVDYVVRGEGERVFLELLQAIKDSRGIEDLNSVSYIPPGGQVQNNPGAESIDLNQYSPHSELYRRFGPVEITRGCPFACHYCQTPRIFPGSLRHRDIDSILKAVRVMIRNNLFDIRFITPNALSYGSEDGKKVNLEAIEQLLSRLRGALGRKGRIFFGSFPSEVRPEQISPEVLELLKKYVDNDNLVIGAQSGSDRILKACHRGHTVEDVYRAVGLTIKAGFKANVDFIFSLPGETPEDVDETERFILELVSMGARVHAHTFMPLPQTPYKNAVVKELDERYQRLINRLLPKGVLFGNWKQQALIAKRLSHLLRPSGPSDTA
ncbi:MAG: TIGR04013 family B12-binding domain/radical SAM domain-containing protein [Nitrospirae bacterium]|nr:TIGR04013 family B12-binding domain/radical SAM domain-containing protein [Nitrospirota bacterium]